MLGSYGAVCLEKSISYMNMALKDDKHIILVVKFSHCIPALTGSRKAETFKRGGVQSTNFLSHLGTQKCDDVCLSCQKKLGHFLISLYHQQSVEKIFFKKHRSQVPGLNNKL